MVNRKEYQREYAQRPESRVKVKIRQHTSEYKMSQRVYFARYNTIPENKARLKALRDIPENKAKKKEYWNVYKIRPKSIVKRKDYCLNLKLKTFIAYSKQISNSDIPICACCGYNDIRFLQMDHIISKKKMSKEFDKIGKTLYQYLKTNKYPTGFQVLCSNCNFAKKGGLECPHQTDKRNANL